MAETKINANQTNITASDLGAIQNTATGTNSLTILGTPCTYINTVNIGESSVTSGQGCVAVGYNTAAGAQSVAIGAGATNTYNYEIAIGANAYTYSSYAIAIGSTAGSHAIGSIQIGTGTNTTAGTLSIGLTSDGLSWANYELLSADGTIPTDRLINTINKYSTMPTAASTNEGWIVQFTGTTDASYTHGYIYECKAQGTNPETYAWEAVEVQASSGGGLPSQTGNAGKFLTTDGTDASWATYTYYDATNKEYFFGDGTRYIKLLLSQDGDNAVGITGMTGNGRAAGSLRMDGWGGLEMATTQGRKWCIAISGDKSFYTYDNTMSLGLNSRKWNNIYLNGKAFVPTINNGADIEVPAVSGTMVVATPPTTDGTYVLKATVSSGVVTYTWVAE